MKVSVLCPHQPQEISDVAPYGAVVSDFGYHRLWAGQSLQIESHMALATLADRSVPVGIGTALAALRTPYDAAIQARSLAAVLSQPVAVAYGAADPGFVTSVRGAPFTRPAGFVAEYTRAVRALLDGEIVSSDFPGMEMTDAQLPTMGRDIAIEAGTGVLRSGMARRSSGVADFVVTWLTPSSYIEAELLPALDVVRRPRIVSMVPVALASPERNAYLLAQASCGNHLRRQHYSDMLNRAGIRNHPSDVASGARALVEQGVFLYGSPAQIVDKLAEYVAIGVDELVLNTTAVAGMYGDEAAVDDLRRIADAVA